MADTSAIAKIKLQYFRSKICTPVKHKRAVKGLGFGREPNMRVGCICSGVIARNNMAIRNLSNLRAPKKANENKKRVGRGMGSGMGKTSTRGHKGQGSSSGSSLMRGFEGGQMPLHRRLPKRGFTNIFRVEYQVLGLDRLAELVAEKNVSEFTLDKIIELGLLRKKGALIKVLNNGEITTAITVHAHKFSKTAQEAIEKAGGKAILIG